jgi:hypothetical protein
VVLEAIHARKVSDMHVLDLRKIEHDGIPF